MLSRAAKAACRKTVYATSVSSAARRSAAAIAVRNTHSSAPHSSAAAAAVASSSTWAAATESAHSVLVQPAGPSKQQLNLDDPLAAITAEIGELKHSLFHMLGSSSPALDSVAKYYFNAEGKHLRPLLVLLMSQATNGIAGPGWAAVEAQAREQLRSRSGGVDNALTSDGGVLNDWNPESMGAEKGGEMVFASPYRIPAEGQQRPLPPAVKQNPFAELLPTGGPGSPTILPTQRRLASIVEMIHVASLLHDDVVDASDLRRGEPSAPAAFGNKLSILSGDFLLGRASVALSRLGSGEVVELMATTIANLIEGEVLQLRATANPATEPTAAGFEEYMRKTYLKTASLMAKSARSAVLLGGCTANETAWVKDVAYGYGRNLGIAFQVCVSSGSAAAFFFFLPSAHTLATRLPFCVCLVAEFSGAIFAILATLANFGCAVIKKNLRGACRVPEGHRFHGVHCTVCNVYNVCNVCPTQEAMPRVMFHYP